MDKLLAALMGALAGAMIIFPAEAAEAARHAMSLWAKSVVPVLGPFLLCARMLSSRLDPPFFLRIFLCWCCGSPGGARIMAGKNLQGKNALRCAAMTGTMSPMFFIGTISEWLGNAKAGWMMLLCHWLAAVLTGLMLPGNKIKARESASSPSFFVLLRETAQAMLPICLCMMLGSISARMISCALPFSPGWVSAGLQCTLEITAGAKSLIALDSPWIFPLLCAACSFGGLSILMQNAAFWKESEVSAISLALLRLIHAALAGLLGLIPGYFLFSAHSL